MPYPFPSTPTPFRSQSRAPASALRPLSGLSPLSRPWARVHSWLARPWARFDLWLGLLAAAGCASPDYGNNLADAGMSSNSAENATASDAAVRVDGKIPDVHVTSGEGIPVARGDAGPAPLGTADAAIDGFGAAQDDTVTGDASTASTPALPLWAMPLVGQYAAQAFSSKEDEYRTVTFSQTVMLVDFVPDGGGLKMRSTMCKVMADNGLATLTLVDPDAFPLQVSEVVFLEQEQRWSTTSAMLPFGFAEQAPDICKGKQGESVPHPATQVWLSGATCHCPLPNEDPVVNDCRVLDPDNDRNPGLTYALRGKNSHLADVDIYAAGISNSRFTNGHVSSDGKPHTANVLPSEKQYQFGCNPTGCASLAGLGTYCAASKNNVQFVRLEPSGAPAGGFTCADIVSRAATLFTNMAPSLATTTCP